MACQCTIPICYNEDLSCERPTTMKFDVKIATIADVFAVSKFCQGEIDRLKILSEEELGAGNDVEFTRIQNERSKFYALWMMCEDEIEGRLSNYMGAKLS